MDQVLAARMVCCEPKHARSGHASHVAVPARADSAARLRSSRTKTKALRESETGSTVRTHAEAQSPILPIFRLIEEISSVVRRNDHIGPPGVLRSYSFDRVDYATEQAV
jgi:hypothetical protein